MNSFKSIPVLNLQQCWQHQKALHCQDHNTAFEILCVYDPRDAKELGRTITMTIQQKKTWDTKREDFMTKIVRAKVNQNQNVKDALLSTGNKRLGESGICDPIYTIGMKLTNPPVLVSDEWNANGTLRDVHWKKSGMNFKIRTICQ